MVRYTLPLLTAALVACTPSSATPEDDALLAARSVMSVATLKEAGSILAKQCSDGFLPFPGGCRAIPVLATVEAAVFPASYPDQLNFQSVSAFLQACLRLASSNPTKASVLCTHLAGLSYSSLLGFNTGRRQLNSMEEPLDNQTQNKTGRSSMAQEEAYGDLLYRLRKGLADIFAVSSFVTDTRNEKGSPLIPQTANFFSDTSLTTSGRDSLNVRPQRETEMIALTTGGDSPGQGPPANPSLVFCRALDEFETEGAACGVVKFVLASVVAAHKRPPCARGSTTRRGPSNYSTSSDVMYHTKAVCSGGAHVPENMPLLPLETYKSILSSSNTSSTRIPVEVLRREGVTYSHLLEAIDQLYQYYDRKQCLPNDFQVPCLLPGWTSELRVDVSQPRFTPSNPLCVFARKGRTLLVAIRGARTPADWALSTDYKLVEFAPGRGESLGNVAAGILQIYATIWPALQTYLITSRAHRPIERIIIAGHSMGAAAGALLSAALAVSVFEQRVDAVLFAAPRVGDARFMEFWGKRVNGRSIQYSLDLITGVPCLRMPVCEATGTVTDGEAPASESSQTEDQLQPPALVKGIPGSYVYGDYPNGVVFQPSDIPNPDAARSNYLRYHHFCAYACWLATHFDSGRKRTMCKLPSDTNTSTDDPTVCTPRRIVTG